MDDIQDNDKEHFDMLYEYRTGDTISYLDQEEKWQPGILVEAGVREVIIKANNGIYTFYKKIMSPLQIKKRLVPRTVQVDLDTDPSWREQERKFRP